MWLLKSIQGGLVWSAGVDVAGKLFDRLLYFFCDVKNLDLEPDRTLFKFARTAIVIEFWFLPREGKMTERVNLR
jgi:hypothetical protein